MTEQRTVTLSIEGEDRRAMPFAVVPFSWVQEYQGSRSFRFTVPGPTPEVVEAGTVEVFVEVITIQLPKGPHTRVNLWCRSGAEHLLNHPQVATYPIARAKIMEGMN